MADPNIQELKFNVTDPTFPGIIKPVRSWRLDVNKSTGSYVLYDISFGSGNPPILRNERVQSGTDANGNPNYIWQTSVVDSYQPIYNGLSEDSKKFLLETMTKNANKQRADFVNQSYTPAQVSSLFPGMSGTKNIARTPPPPPPPGPAPDPLTPGPNPDPLTSQPIDPNAGGIVSSGELSGIKPSEKISKVLKYPLYESRGYDYLKVQILEYIPGGVPRLSSANLGISDVQDRPTTILGTIFLPMQSGISDGAGSSWNEDRLSPVQAALGSFATDTINSLGGLNFGKAIQNIRGSAGGLQQILAQNPTLEKFIDTYFAGQLVGSNLFARESGAVINPNLELLFDGPKMRTFNYNYRFTPRDNEEAKEVRRIIKFLKKNSQPKKDPNGLFLKTPNIFQLEYIYGETGEMHPFMNKIKKCALTDMSVNYTPDGSYMTYNDGSMTSYTVTLSFSELSPIYYDDFEDNESPTMDF